MEAETPEFPQDLHNTRSRVLSSSKVDSTTQTILMPHIEKIFFYIEYVLTYFMHLFNFICLEKLGKFFCLESGWAW